MKILWLTDIPSPYRVDFFNELGKHCQLTVLFERKSSVQRNDLWKNYKFINFEGVFLKGIHISKNKVLCLEALKYLKHNRYDYIVFANMSSATGMISIEWCQLKKISYIIEGDGAFAKNGNGIKERLKKHFISKGSMFFSTCEEHDQYYTHYGADSEKIIRYPFSSLKKSDILDAPVSADEKKTLRNKLNIKNEKMILAVGQFIYRKGFDLLLAAATHISSDIGIYIVGDNPTEEYVSFVKSNNLFNVYFVGFKSKSELKEYYKAADLFVLPTREDIWGLVINEAMAYGLPVITSDRCNAGLELVQDGVNGYIIPVDSIDALEDSINSALAQSANMGKASLDRIAYYTIENMANIHISFFKEYLNSNLEDNNKWK